MAVLVLSELPIVCGWWATVVDAGHQAGEPAVHDDEGKGFLARGGILVAEGDTGLVDDVEPHRSRSSSSSFSSVEGWS